MLRPLPPTYGDTTRSLHRLAVYVISPAQRFANDEIILRATPGGFGTFPFGDRDRVVRVDGGQLVVEEGAAEIASSPIGTIASAAQILGIDPDLAQQELFDVPPAGDIHAPLHVDPAAAEALHRWYAFAENVLEELRSDAAPQDDVTSVRLWPEHFDSAIDLGEQGAGRRATYGGSPGDRHHPEPYLYAAPWEGRIDPFFDDRGFRGRALGYDELLKADDPREAALAFLRHARALIGAR